MNRSVSPCIAVMARAPVVGRCKSRLAAKLGAARATSIYKAMLLDTLAAIEQTFDARLVVAATPEEDGVATLRALAPARWEIPAQRGEGLGERLGNVLRDLEAPAVALVDSDSPTAAWSAAGRAFRALVGPKRALLGACDDGGYWLLATTAMDPGLFEAISWSTPRVAEQTRARCAALGLAVEELPVAYDVDEIADLDRLRAELRLHPERAPRTARELDGA